MNEITYIADPGTNFCGSMEALKKIAYECKRIGVIIFKPQLFDATVLYTDKNNKYYDLQCKCSLTSEQTEEIYGYCKDEIKLDCIFSPFDIPRLKWIVNMGLDTVKVASRMSNDVEFLREISNYALFPIITISKQHTPLPLNEYTDMFGKNGYQLLHGNSKYPSMIKDYELQTAKLYNGLSNHVLDNGSLMYACIGVGVSTIEFHVYNKYVDTPDMKVSYPIHKMSEIINNCNELAKIR